MQKIHKYIKIIDYHPKSNFLGNKQDVLTLGKFKAKIMNPRFKARWEDVEQEVYIRVDSPLTGLYK